MSEISKLNPTSVKLKKKKLASASVAGSSATGISLGEIFENSQPNSDISKSSGKGSTENFGLGVVPSEKKTTTDTSTAELSRDDGIKNSHMQKPIVG